MPQRGVLFLAMVGVQVRRLLERRRHVRIFWLT
jgi:hypothetical protein